MKQVEELTLMTLKDELQDICNRYGGILTIAAEERDVDISLMAERPRFHKVCDIVCKIEIKGVT